MNIFHFLSTMQMVLLGIALILVLRWLYLRIKYRREIFIVNSLNKIKSWSDEYNSPKGKLGRAQEAVEVLRAGYWVNNFDEKIYLDSGEYSGIAGRLSNITEALEAGFSYEQIGTTRDEVIGFRNGDAHKTSARLQLEESRLLEQSPMNYEINNLAEDAGFALEEVGTSEAELESLSKEYSRRIWERSVQRFRDWATGVSDRHENPDEFEKELVMLLSPEHYYFSYENLGTTREECAEMIRLARRREVLYWVDYLKCNAEKGDTDNSFARKMIDESLEKAGLALSDFNIAESNLDEIERSAYIIKARNLLGELRVPGEGWFYSDPTSINHNVRFYRPALLECIPGDPLVFVKKIKENLTTANATLADIGTSEPEIKTLVRAGHLASAKFLLEELKRVSQTPRKTQFERIASILDPKTIVMDDLNNPIDRETLEESYPIERDIQAIEYHLNGAGIELEEIRSSRQKLQELRAVIETR